MFKRFHDSIPESRKLGQVSDFAFRCWTVGLSKADWFGRLTAEPDKFKVVCFPNRSQVTEEDIMRALDELADAGRVGLIHLYMDEEGERFLVFHNHDDHNPSGDWKTKPKKCPQPPKSICKCVKFTLREDRNSLAGKEFRFNSGKNASGQLLARENASGQSLNLLLSSPLLSSQDKEGCGEEKGDVEKLCNEFTSLTGRPPLSGSPDPEETLERIRGLIRVRGLEPMVRVMKLKASECVQRTGRPPNSLQYFMPIFEDERLFGSGSNDGAQAVVKHFALPPGHFDAEAQRRIAERERRGKEGEPPGGVEAPDGGQGGTNPA